MPRTGRPALTDPTVQWCFRIPVSLASRFDLVLTDEITSTIQPGRRQELLVPLLQRLWHAAITGQPTIDVSDVITNLRSRMGVPNND